MGHLIQPLNDLLAPLLKPGQKFIDRITGHEAAAREAQMRTAREPQLEDELRGLVKAFKEDEKSILEHHGRQHEAGIMLKLKCYNIIDNNPAYVPTDDMLDQDVAEMMGKLMLFSRPGTLKSADFIAVASVSHHSAEYYRKNAEKFIDLTADNLELVDNITPRDVAEKPLVSKGGTYLFGASAGIHEDRTWRYPMVQKTAKGFVYHLEEDKGTNLKPLLKKFEENMDKVFAHTNNPPDLKRLTDASRAVKEFAEASELWVNGIDDPFHRSVMKLA